MTSKEWQGHKERLIAQQWWWPALRQFTVAVWWRPMLVFIIKAGVGRKRHRPTQVENRPVATLHLHQLCASQYCCANLKAKVEKVQLGSTRCSFCCHGCARQCSIMHTRGLFSHLVSVFALHRCPQHAVSVAELLKNTCGKKHLPNSQRLYIQWRGQSSTSQASHEGRLCGTGEHWDFTAESSAGQDGQCSPLTPAPTPPSTLTLQQEPEKPSRRGGKQEPPNTKPNQKGVKHSQVKTKNQWVMNRLSKVNVQNDVMASTNSSNPGTWRCSATLRKRGRSRPLLLSVPHWLSLVGMMMAQQLNKTTTIRYRGCNKGEKRKHRRVQQGEGGAEQKKARATNGRGNTQRYRESNHGGNRIQHAMKAGPSQRVVHIKSTSEFICCPDNSWGKWIPFQNIILIHKVDEMKHHAPKTHSHAFSTNSRSSQTILHHFQRCAQINHHEHHVVATLSLSGKKRSTYN